MKHLLGTLYVITDGFYLSLDNENVCVNSGRDVVKKYPLINISNIVCFTYKGASPALMGECANRNIGLSFFTPYGKFLARVTGSNYGNVLLRKEQYRKSDDVIESCLISRNLIVGKVYNARSIIKRILRDHSYTINQEKLEQCANDLMNLTRKARICEDLEQLRGLEGHAAQLYFGVFDELILNHSLFFNFNSRNKRPPKDPVNALLSFLYVVLANDCASALEGVGLDSYVGFMHRDRSGRKSLGLDLMEELRPIIVDRCVLYLLNNRMLNSNHFYNDVSGAVFLNDEGRKIVLAEWEKRKKETITHPFLHEKIPYGLIPHIQALLLARFIRGDIEEYPAFLWK